MKNLFKKTIATVLCMATLSGSACATSANAYTETQPAVSFSFLNIIVDITERVSSVFSGSKNNACNLEYTFEKNEIFESGKYFDSAHASTLVKMSNGDIISAWFGGSEEKAPDVRIWYSINKGGVWTEPKQIETEDNAAHWNPVFQNFDGFTRLYYKVGVDTKKWVTKYVDTYDCGETWTAPQELVEGDTSGGRGPVKNKCLITDAGVIIAPASTEQGSWRAFFDISTDGGKTWTKTDFVAGRDLLGMNVQMIQPTLWQDADGEIHAMFRTKSGRIYRSDSTDGGFTWCEAYATDLMNNNSGIDCVTTDNGWLWLAYNPIGIDGLRNRLILSVSKDNGETWEDVMSIEETPMNLFTEFSYPSIIADGNSVHITYTYNRETVKYIKINF